MGSEPFSCGGWCRGRQPVQPRRASQHRDRHRGFTLLELLVVIAVISVLASLLLPTLAGSLSKAKTSSCRNNHRQLAVAWLLYAGDHADNLPYNLGATETKRTVAGGQYLNWVNNVMNWELDPDNTNVLLLARGGLGPFTDGEPRVYRCPKDQAASDLQRGAGWNGRVRSLSMNALVGDAGEFTTAGSNVNVPEYTQFFRLTEILEPAKIFVFVDEHPDSINDAYFLNRPASKEWNDLPGSYHEGAANFAFADGHVETHRWLEAGTKPPPQPDAAALPRAVPEDEDRDFYWLLRRTSVREYSPSAK